MKQLTGKHIVTAALTPLIFLSLVTWTISMLRYREFNGIGLIVGMYYFIPVMLFGFLLLSVIRFFEKRRLFFLSSSLIGHILVSAAVAAFLLTAWIFTDGLTRYHEIGFGRYWLSQLKFYWFPTVFFVLSIPVMLNVLQKRKARRER